MAGAFHVHTLRLPCGDPASLFERVEVARGSVPRERWIQEAILAHLDRQEAAGSPLGRLFDRTEGDDAPRVRSSASARAKVKPIPKGAKK